MAYYAPGGEAFSFPPPAVDHVGLWAIPPGLPYPPADGRPLLFVGYCSDALPLPAGYRVEGVVRYRGNDLCVTSAAR